MLTLSAKARCRVLEDTRSQLQRSMLGHAACAPSLAAVAAAAAVEIAHRRQAGARKREVGSAAMTRRQLTRQVKEAQWWSVHAACETVIAAVAGCLVDSGHADADGDAPV